MPTQTTKSSFNYVLLNLWWVPGPELNITDTIPAFKEIQWAFTIQNVKCYYWFKPGKTEPYSVLVTQGRHDK